MHKRDTRKRFRYQRVPKQMKYRQYNHAPPIHNQDSSKHLCLQPIKPALEKSLGTCIKVKPWLGQASPATHPRVLSCQNPKLDFSLMVFLRIDRSSRMNPNPSNDSFAESSIQDSSSISSHYLVSVPNEGGSNYKIRSLIKKA